MTDKSSNYSVSIDLIGIDNVSGVAKKIVADVTSSVDAIASKTAVAVAPIRKMGEAWNDLKSSVQGMTAPLQGVIRGYMRLQYMTGLTLGGVVRGAININSHFEDMGIGLAAVLQSVDQASGGPYKKFSDAQTKVNALMADMRQEAVNTGTDLDTVVESFQSIMPFARQLKVSLEDIVKLSGNTAVWDDIVGKKGGTAQDVKQLLSGQATLRMVQNPILNAHFNDLHALSKQMLSFDEAGNKQGALAKKTEMLKEITRLLTMSDEAMKAKENSLTGRWKAFKNVMEVAFLQATSPVYKVLEAVIGKATQWVQQNPQKIANAAAGFANLIAGAADKLISAFGWIYDHWTLVSSAIKDFVAVWEIVTIGKFLAGLKGFAEAVAAWIAANVLPTRGGGGGVTPILPGKAAAAAEGEAAAVEGAVAKRGFLGEFFMGMLSPLALLGYVQQPGEGKTGTGTGFSGRMSEYDSRRQALSAHGFDPVMNSQMMEGFGGNAVPGHSGEGLFALLGDILAKKDAAANLDYLFGGAKGSTTQVELNVNVKSDGSTTVTGSSSSPTVKITGMNTGTSPMTGSEGAQ